MVTINAWLNEVRRRHIIEPITRDVRETRESQTRLGLPVWWIFQNAVGGGQASFDEPVEPLSPRDRVMLYAFLLQKGHIGELTHAFELLLSKQPHLLQGATIVDIGCGPFTSGLALANVAGNSTAFRYVGVDTSQQMRTLGCELAHAAMDASGLHPGASIAFVASLDYFDFGSSRAGWTIVVLSYLLASPTIDVALLVRQIVDACNRIGPGPVALLYTNSARDEARAAFPEFCDRLQAEGFLLNIGETETLTDGEKPRNIHYALFTRLGGPPIPLERFRQ